MYKQLIMLSIAVMYSENSIIPHHNLLSEDLMKKSTDQLKDYNLKTHQNLSSDNIIEHKLYLLSNQNPAFITFNYTKSEYFIEFKSSGNLLFWSFIGLNTIWMTYNALNNNPTYSRVTMATMLADLTFIYFAYYTKLLDYNYWIKPIFHNSADTEETARDYLLSNKKYYDNVIFYSRFKWVSLFILSIGIKCLAVQIADSYNLPPKQSIPKPRVEYRFPNY